MEIFSYTLKNIFSKYGKKYFLNNEIEIFSSQLTASIFYPRVFAVFYNPKDFSFLSNFQNISFIDDGSIIRVYKNKITELKSVFEILSVKFSTYLSKIAVSKIIESAEFFFNDNLFSKNIFPSLNFVKLFTRFLNTSVISQRIFYTDLFNPREESLIVNNPELFYTVFPPSVLIFIENFFRRKFYEFTFRNQDKIILVNERISEKFIRHIQNGHYGVFNSKVYEIIKKVKFERDKLKNSPLSAIQQYSDTFYSIFVSCVYNKFIQYNFWDKNFEKENVLFFKIFQKNIQKYSERIISIVYDLFNRYKFSPEIFYSVLKYTILYYVKQNNLGVQIYKTAILEKSYEKSDLKKFNFRNYIDFVKSIEKIYDIENFSNKIKNAMINNFIKVVLNEPKFVSDVNYFGAIDKIIERLFYTKSSTFIDKHIMDTLDELLSLFLSHIDGSMDKKNYYIEISKYQPQIVLLPFVWILHKVIPALRDL